MKNKHPFWTKLDWRVARPLTLRELIMKSNFQTMMKYIIAFDKKMANQGNHFCRACECIRDMKVKAHSEDYILAEYDSKYNEPYIGVLEGASWHEWLGYPVKRAKDLHCTDTKLAAICLWHLTFYGYTPKEQKEEAERYFEREERERRNDEFYLADDLYDDEYGVAGRGFVMKRWKGCSHQKKSSKSSESARKSWIKKTQAMMRQKRKKESS